MNEDKKVSIIVPVYNTEAYIESCLDSIKKQTYKNFEVLLINDGSTDNSKKICEMFVHNDDRFKLFNQVNCGLSKSRNNGIKKSKGDLILFVDADDQISANLLEKSITILNEYEVDTVIFSYSMMINGKQKNSGFKDPNLGSISAEKALAELFSGHFGSYSWKILTYRKIYIDYDIYFPNNRHYEDIATTYRIIAASKMIYLTSQQLYYYEQRNNSITHIHDDNDLDDMIRTFSEIRIFIKNQFPGIEYLITKLEFNMIFMLLIRMGNWKDKFPIRYSKAQKKYLISAIKHLDKISKYFKQDIHQNRSLHLKLVLLKLKIFPVLIFVKNHAQVTSRRIKK